MPFSDGVAGITRPRLRDNVVLRWSRGRATLSARDRVCTLRFQPGARAAVTAFIERLRAGGHTPKELAREHPELAEQIADILSELDELRLLTESDRPDSGPLVSGLQLDREVRRLVEALEIRLDAGRFQRELVAGRATRRALIGYVLEYHWIVHMAPALIAPALATATTAMQRRLLERFMASELGHDAFLRRSLAAVDVHVSDDAIAQPLPSTFAIGASLGVYATQHPLSFGAALFLFERPQDEFVAAFERRCAQLGLPKEFHAPLRAHAELNRAGDHDAISTALLEQVAVVDAEARAITKSHVAILVETMIRQEHEILRYYTDETQPLPRLFT